MNMQAYILLQVGAYYISIVGCFQFYLLYNEVLYFLSRLATLSILYSEMDMIDTYFAVCRDSNLLCENDVTICWRIIIITL